MTDHSYCRSGTGRSVAALPACWRSLAAAVAAAVVHVLFDLARRRLRRSSRPDRPACASARRRRRASPRSPRPSGRP